MTAPFQDRPRPNPSFPRVWLKLKRQTTQAQFGENHDEGHGLFGGGADTEVTYMKEIQPLSMEYVSSTEVADRLEITVPDPAYEFINNHMLIEDLKTIAEFRFGYAGTTDFISPTMTMVFYRQQPNFAGEVTTKLVFYDYGVWLAQAFPPRVYTQFESINALIRMMVADLNTLYGLTPPLEVDFGTTAGAEPIFEYKSKKYPVANTNLYDILGELAERAIAPHSTQKVEVFVDTDAKGRPTLYFRHPQIANVKDIGVYTYFSGIPGSPLLEFQPEVSTSLEKYKVAGMDHVTGNKVGSSASATAPNQPRDTTGQGSVLVNSNVARVEKLIPHRPATGSRSSVTRREPKPVEIEHVILRTDARLETIAEKYNGTSVQQIAERNGLDPVNYTLTPGNKLIIPISNDDETVETDDSEAQAKTDFTNRELHMVTAKATLVGDPRIKAGWPLWIQNVGHRWTGRWYITEASHRMDSGGFLTELSLVRNGLPVIQEGIDRNSSDSLNDGPPPETATAAKQAAAAAARSHANANIAEMER